MFPYAFWQDEHDFWKKLLERYLAPIVDDKAHKEEVTRELKSLRNKVGFSFLYAIYLLCYYVKHTWLIEGSYFVFVVLQAVFLYFIINVLWIVATFFLQAIGNDVISIKIQKVWPNGTSSGEYLKVEPLSLMFLLSFAVLLVVQFLAMLYHRWANISQTQYDT